MRIGSLFSGAGGLDLAAEHVFGGDVVWHCENDAAASKVLAHRWPGVSNLHDVTTVNWESVESADVLCGGYPCQPFSAAGQRKGTDDERHLWPYFAEAIRYLRPRYVVLENVAGHRILGFHSVLADLAGMRYDTQWCSVRASDVGAPHRRERLFVLATDAEHVGLCGEADHACAWEPDTAGRDLRVQPSGRGATVADSAVAERRGTQQQHLGTPRVGAAEPRERFGASAIRGGNAVADSSGDGRHEGWPEPARLQRGSDAPQWGKYEPAIRRWEQATRPAPAPTEPNKNGNPLLSAAFSEWMMGWPAGWVTQVPGISRNDQLRIIGNGVCPQQAIHALQWLLHIAEVAA